MLGHFGAPFWDRPFHYFDPRGEAEFFNQVARPFLALVAGVKPFPLHTVSDFAQFAITVYLSGRVRLHTAQALGLFRLCPVEFSHDRLEFPVPIPGGDVNAASPAIQPARSHQVLIPDFLFAPPLHNFDTSIGKCQLTRPLALFSNKIENNQYPSDVGFSY
jgi:hypothetical protein